jgi:hypothetical protein
VTFFQTLEPNGESVATAHQSDAFNAVVRETGAKRVLLVPSAVSHEIKEPWNQSADVYILEAPVQNMTAVMVSLDPFAV